MDVKLIASTALAENSLGEFEIEQNMKSDWNSTESDDLTEFAGRACYQSFHKPNRKTARNEDYMANILRQGHESVLEHASATFYITGVSRALTHELIRHRHLSFSELSQRFVDVEDVPVVYPPATGSYERRDIDLATDEARAMYASIVESLMGKGFKRKQAREAARAVMPNATETRIVVTGNHRAWRDVLRKRWHVAADAEIREFAGEVLTELRKIAPATFQDVPLTPYGE